MKLKLIAIVLVLLLAGGRSDAQTALTPLRIAAAPDDDVTPILYAQSAGLFRAAGMDVSLQAVSSGTAVAAAVIGGSDDIGKSNMLALVVAHARGIPLTIVAPSGLYTSSIHTAALIVPKDSPLHSARDLAGKVVSVPALNDMQALSSRAWIDKNGGDSTTVHFIEVPAIAVAVALDTGRIDAGALSNPAISQALASGKYRVLGYNTDGIGDHFMTVAWFARADYAKNNADLMRRFNEVVRQASIYANDHHAQTVDLIARFSGADPAVIAKTPRSLFATTLTPSDIQPVIDTAAKYGVIPKRFDASEMIGN